MASKKRKPEYSRSGAAAQHREEEITLSKLRAIFQLFAAPPRRCERIIS
jgi:hypothetical protein